MENRYNVTEPIQTYSQKPAGTRVRAGQGVIKCSYKAKGGKENIIAKLNTRVLEYPME